MAGYRTTHNYEGETNRDGAARALVPSVGDSGASGGSAKPGLDPAGACMPCSCIARGAAGAGDFS